MQTSQNYCGAYENFLNFKKFHFCPTALKRKSHSCIPRKGIARPLSKFPHWCVCERCMHSQDRSTYSIFLQQHRLTDRGNIEIAHRHMNVEIGTEPEQFLFWKYLFRIFRIMSLQCVPSLVPQLCDWPVCDWAGWGWPPWRSWSRRPPWGRRCAAWPPSPARSRRAAGQDRRRARSS